MPGDDMAHFSGGRLVSKQSLINKAVFVVSVLCFGCQPTVPSENKWTKMGPCVAFFVIAMFFGIFKAVAKEAYDAMNRHFDFAEVIRSTS